MSKKYVPSGYQIITLPEIATGTQSWNKLDEDIPEEIKKLYDLCENKRFENKPLLIHSKINGWVLSGFVPFNVSDDGISIVGELYFQSQALLFTIEIELSVGDITITLSQL